MLSIRDLSVGYDKKIVASLPALLVQSRQTCLLKGQSGSGKTTLLNAIAGLGHKLNGHITLNNIDIYQLAEAERDVFRGRNIGIIFQTLHLVKSLNVLDNLFLSPYVAGQTQDRAAAIALLQKLGLADLADRPAFSISQGQAQRIALARALLSQPKLILADEPTSSLDDKSCQATMDLLLSSCREAGAALVVASHDARISAAFDMVITLESEK